VADLAALDAAYAQLPHTSATSDAIAMLAAAQALTDVQSADLSDSMTVSITYNNGMRQVIALAPLIGPNDGIAPAATTSPAQTLQPHIQDAVLPSGGAAGRVAYLYDIFNTISYARLGTTITDASQDTPVAPLTSWFKNAPYAVTNSLQNQPTSSGTPVTVSNGNITQVSNASVLFLHTHGAYWKDTAANIAAGAAPYTYVLATSYEANLDNLTAFENQLFENPIPALATMIIFTYPLNYFDNTGRLINSTIDLLSITPLFVSMNMTFAPNSVVFSDSCLLMMGYPLPKPPAVQTAMGAASQEMVQAFFDAGAGAVLGWDQYSNLVQAADSAMYFFDRVLGAGADGLSGGYGSVGVAGGYLAYPAGPAGPAGEVEFPPVNPPNRPFNIGAVFEEMSTTPRQSNDQPSAIFANVQGLAPIADQNLNQTAFVSSIMQNPNTLVLTAAPGAVPIIATLQMQMNPAGAPALTGTPALMPTISAVNLLNNSNQLIVYGDFGGSYDTRSITIGGNDVTASATWTSGQITVNNLPLSGGGSGGNILVTIDGLQSNHLLLNQWNDIPLKMITNNGSAQRTVSCDIDLRASFDALRQGPDLMPATNAVTTDNAVLENGECQFSATNPNALDVPIPWINPYTLNGQPFPATGADAYAINPTQDGLDGGSMALSLQAGYCDQPQGGLFCFLDTAATPAAGPVAVNQLVFSDDTQNLGAGTAPQQLGSLSWMSTPGLTPDPLEAR
jgi:hypothetical protein